MASYDHKHCPVQGVGPESSGSICRINETPNFGQVAFPHSKLGTVAARMLYRALGTESYCGYGEHKGDRSGRVEKAKRRCGETWAGWW